MSRIYSYTEQQTQVCLLFWRWTFCTLVLSCFRGGQGEHWTKGHATASSWTVSLLQAHLSLIIDYYLWVRCWSRLICPYHCWKDLYHHCWQVSEGHAQSILLYYVWGFPSLFSFIHMAVPKPNRISTSIPNLCVYKYFLNWSIPKQKNQINYGWPMTFT